MGRPKRRLRSNPGGCHPIKEVLIADRGRRAETGPSSFFPTEAEDSFLRARFTKHVSVAILVGISLVAAACGVVPRVTNFDAARVAVEVSESASSSGMAGTYAIALLEFGDLRDRYSESQVEATVRDLVNGDGLPILESDELVWASVVTIDVGQGRAEGFGEDRPLHYLVLIDTTSGLPLFTVPLESNLALPGGLHTVSELERAP